MTADQFRRLRDLRLKAEALSLEIRTARGGAEPGPGKATLRAVGRFLETAVHAVDRAAERAGV